jgi:GH35 family endo-1,4-beta-xylanase
MKILMFAVLLTWLGSTVQAFDRASLMATADERIEQYRKRDATLQLLTPDGSTLPDGTIVSVDLVNHAFLFGANLFEFGGQAQHQPVYLQRFVELNNYAILPFYWHAYEPQPKQMQLERWVAAARWCREQGITTKGHPLVWNLEPDWLKALPGEQKEKLLWARVAGLTRQYAGLIDRWDVVNEATEGVQYARERSATSLLHVFEKYGTNSVINHAFKLARQANPKAQLVLNDYETTRAFERTIRRALDSGANIDVIGVQSHMHEGYWGVEKTWEICERFARLGKPLHFTEVTILSGRLKDKNDHNWINNYDGWHSSVAGEQRQARQVGELYKLLFSHPAVEAISWWDFSDREAWLRAPGGLLRSDMQPKPAYYVLQDLIKKGWSTHLQQATHDAGLTMRGFYGDYRVTTEVAGQQLTGRFTLDKGDDGPISVPLR